MHRRTRFGLLFILIVLGGCSTHQPPVIRVGEATLAQISDEALSVDVSIELENPNVEPLELQSISYTLSIDGRAVYAGRRAAEATLARAAIKAIEIPAVVRYDRVAWDGGPPAEAEWSISGQVIYVKPGELAEILLDARLIKPTQRFGGGGIVALR